MKSKALQIETRQENTQLKASRTARHRRFKSNPKTPGQLCTTSNGSKLVYVDSTVPQTSPLKSGLTPFLEEEDEKATVVAGVGEHKSTHENEKSKNDSKIQKINDQTGAQDTLKETQE